MEALITRGIKVSVETFYQPAYSRPLEMKYIFSYHITIENLGALMTEMGKMYGTYLFARDSDGEQFRVNIPEFQLLAPFKLN